MTQASGRRGNTPNVSHTEHEQTARELSCLLSVSEFLRSMTDLADLDDVLRNVLDKALEVTSLDIGGILLWDSAGQLLGYRVHRGLSEDYVAGIQLRPGEGLAGKVSSTGTSVHVTDILADSGTAYPDLIIKEGLRAFASVPLPSEDGILGVLNVASREVRRFSTEDMRLLESIGGQIGAAIEKVRLHAEVRHKEELRGELLADVFTIQEEERRRIARELHDEISQVVASLNAGLEAAAAVLPAGSERSLALLRKAQGQVITILDDIHKLIYELRPTVLDDMGLVPATRWLLDNTIVLPGVSVKFRSAGQERRLSPKMEITLFRVIQEAAGNIVRHAQPKNVILRLAFRKDTVAVHIADDGRGFNVDEAITSKDRPRGLGLLGMRERVESIGGTFSIVSKPEGGGTKIDIEVPLAEESIDG